MKNRVFSSLFITTLFLVLLHSPLTSAQVHESVTLPYDYSIAVTSAEIKYFSIDLSQRPENVDVTLSVLSAKGTAPKLYVSKDEANQFPQDPKANYYSTNYGGNIIFVPSSDLVGIQKLYVGLACGVSRCDTDVTFEYAREFTIPADGSRVVESSYTLKGASSAVVRLTVPDAPNAERIVIHVDAIPNDDNSEITPDLNVFINAGTKIPFTNSGENIPRTSWFEGRTIVIYKGTELFCTGCTYTMSLKFNPYSSLSVEAHVFDKDMELDANAILDGVQRERYNTYSFTVPEAKKEEDFVINIKPQEGSPTLYINCDTRPSDFSKYYWTYKIDGATELILTSREHKACQSGIFFLLVSSREPTVYSIRLSTTDTNKLFVGKDAPIMGDIFPNEIISYEIFVPLFAAEEIIVELTSDPKVSLDIINCRFPTDCPGLLPGGIEFRHQLSNDSAGSYNPPEFQYETKDVDGTRTITINPHTTGCYPIIIQDDDFMEDPIPVCAYKITLNSENTYPSEYKLRALSQGHQWLFIGLPKSDSVEHNDTAYYMLNVPHVDATKVNIQLTKFSGDVNVYVSRSNKYPDAENDETEFSHEGMIIFQNKPDLNGTYYIGVHGIETSSYSISATVLTSNNKTEDYAQTLSLGVPQKGVLLPKHEHPARFYKFELDLPDDWEGYINVDINPLRGSLLTAVNNNGLIPMPNLHMWKSTGRELQISSDDEYFVNKGTYYIGVFVDWNIQQPDYEDLTFTVVYYLKEFSAWTDTPDNKSNPVAQQNFQHLFLSPLTPFHRSIKSTDTDYYEAFILPKDTGITLYKQADAGDVDIFVSLDPDVEYPDENQYTYTTRTTHKDSLSLSQDDLTKACESSGMKLCTFYIAVIPRKDTDIVSYSLTMKREYEKQTPSVTASVTPLEDGRQVQLDVPTNSTAAYFYFYNVPYHPSVITVSCPGEEVKIYANRNLTKVGTGIKPNFAPPTEDLYEFTSFTSDSSNVGLAHLTIPAQNYMDSSVITLAVYFKHPTRAAASLDPDTKFTILVSSQMTHIYTGKPYAGAVEAGKYMYFSLNVYKPSCTLLISMTTLNDGDPDLIVSTSKDTPPTINSHQFASISKQKTELLEINELDIYPKTSMEGTWVIGVYGRTDSTFTLTVLDEDQKMVELKADTPFEMYLREESIMYFKYYHGKPDTVDIRIDQISGDVIAHVATVSAGETVGDMVTTLSDAANYKWEMNPKILNALTIKTDNEKACSQCMYLIVVEAKQSSKLSISITEGERFVKIQNGMSYTDQLISLNKKYMFSSSNAEEVTLSVNLKGDALKIYASQNPEVSEANYIWYTELSYEKPTKIITFTKSEMENNPEYKSVSNGVEDVKSEKNSFYIVFENPNPGSPISYTFTVTSKDSSPILKPGSKHMLTLDESEATSLIYYSAKDDQVIKLNIEFEVVVDANDQSFDKILKKGVPVTATFWSEKTTAGKGTEAPLIKDHVMKDSVKSSGNTKTYVIREGFTLESLKGKYSFDLENPFGRPINIWATVYSSEFGTLQLDQNSQHSSVLTKSMTETYEVYLAKSGSWYLWTYSCLGDTSLSIAENPNNLDAGIFQKQTLRQGGDYLHAVLTDTQSTQYAKLETLTDDGSLFVMSSKFFPNEARHYNYNLNLSPAKVQLNYQYQALNSQITVNAPPLSISNYDDNDDIVYHVKLCPVKMNDPDGPQNVCNIHEECRVFQTQYKISSQGSIQATFDRLQPGEHYVHVVADIMHKNQLIKFIAYQPERITIDKPITEQVSSNSLLIVIVALLGLIIAGFVCYKCYGRLQRFGEEKGFELPTIGKKRGYGFIGDDL